MQLAIRQPDFMSLSNSPVMRENKVVKFEARSGAVCNLAAAMLSRRLGACIVITVPSPRQDQVSLLL